MNWLTWLARASAAMALILFVALLVRLCPAIAPIRPADAIGIGWGGSRATLRPGSMSVSLGSVAAHSRISFTVLISNDGECPAKLVGAPALCRREGCVRVAEDPVTIGPRQSAQVRFYLDSSEFGLAKWTTEMYFDVGDKEGITVPIAITATVTGLQITQRE